MRSRVEGTYIAEKEDETEGEDEGGRDGVRESHARTLGLIVAFTSADSRRIERKRRGRTEREKKMPDSQDPRTPSGGGERAYVSNAEEISCGLTSRSVDLRDRPLPTRPICSPPALVD